MPPAGIVVDVSDAVMTVVRAGGGIGISPTHLAAPYVRRGEIVPVLADFAVNAFNVTALWPDSRRASPNVKAFIAFLAELFPSPAPWDVDVLGVARIAAR
jgi:DNA-binding transcriptional LysR family regulator